MGRERWLVPQGRLNPFPAVSAVPAGLAELLDLFPGLKSGASSFYIFKEEAYDIHQEKLLWMLCFGFVSGHDFSRAVND